MNLIREMKSKDLGTLNHKLCFVAMSVAIVGEVTTENSVRSCACTGTTAVGDVVVG